MTAWPSALGRPGAAAAVALAAAVLLATWLTPQWQAQAEARPPAVIAAPAAAPAPALPSLPAAGDPAERVADLLALALRHGVNVGRTQQQRQRQGTVERLQLGLSAQGRYADLRAFVAAALQADAGLALDTLQLRRASADVGEFEAELQWSLLQAEAQTAAAAPPPPPRGAWPASATAAIASWSGPPPPPPPPPPPVAVATQAPIPTFPYRWIGRLDDGVDPQALLVGPQRSFGARAGDVLDGRWRIDRVAAAQLQLTWLPTGEAVKVDNR